MSRLEACVVPHHEGSGIRAVTKLRQDQKAVMDTLSSLSTSASGWLGGLKTLTASAGMALTVGGSNHVTAREALSSLVTRHSGAVGQRLIRLALPPSLPHRASCRRR
jgi:hypothetical protein